MLAWASVTVTASSPRYLVDHNSPPCCGLGPPRGKRHRECPRLFARAVLNHTICVVTPAPMPALLRWWLHNLGHLLADRADSLRTPRISTCRQIPADGLSAPALTRSSCTAPASPARRASASARARCPTTRSCPSRSGPTSAPSRDNTGTCTCTPLWWLFSHTLAYLKEA